MTRFLFTYSLLLTTLWLNAQSAYVYTNAGNVGLTLSNVGFIGNSFRGVYHSDNFPSCEYPINSGVEHLFEGGLWIGAKIRGSENVSTAAMDNARGYSTGASNYEFTAEEGEGFRERSSILNSKVYDPSAVSHQDYICNFTDKHIIVPGTQIRISNHVQPLGLEIHLEAYNWNYSFSNFFVILDYTIKNTGVEQLNDVYIGMFANAVVRNINKTAAGSGGTAFYNKGGNGYNDSLHLGYCFDAAGDIGFTESYFGHKFLGAESKDGFHHPSIDTSFKAHYNCWQWGNTSEPILFSPQSDKQRYSKMSSGLNYKENWNEQTDSNHQHTNYLYKKLLAPGNRSDLVSVGPFLSLNPGEEIKIAFAIVCAKKNEDGKPNVENNAFQQSNLVSNALWAQTAYCGEDVNCNGVLDPGEDKNNNGVIDRYILPSPPDIPETKYVPRNNAIDIYWKNNSEASVDPISQKKDFAGYAIYTSKLGFDTPENVSIDSSWQKVAMFDKAGDSLFYETGFDSIRLEEPITIDGEQYHYKYTINNLVNGWQYAVTLTSFDTGDKEAKVESLESSRNSNLTRAFMGTPPNENPKENEPFVYPNPYYLSAAWEGNSSQQTSNRIQFANLPARCVIHIFSMAGDLIHTIEHDQNYTGDIAWYQAKSDTEKTSFSGGEHSWDLISSEGQNIARGLYLFTVKDLDNNKLYKGQFTIIK